MNYCINGHNKIGSNLYICPRGKSVCKECRKLQSRSFRRRRNPALLWSPKEKLLSKTKKDENNCWLWQGCKNQDGYGQYSKKSAHRYSYELFVSKIPQGLEIDHLCRVRHCINPDHMEAVTHKENIARADYTNVGTNLAEFQRSKTHCKRNHPYKGNNLRIEKRTDGGIARRCKQCDAIRTKTYLSSRTLIKS